MTTPTAEFNRLIDELLGIQAGYEMAGSKECERLDQEMHWAREELNALLQSLHDAKERAEKDAERWQSLRMMSQANVDQIMWSLVDDSEAEYRAKCREERLDAAIRALSDQPKEG